MTGCPLTRLSEYRTNLLSGASYVCIAQCSLGNCSLLFFLASSSSPACKHQKMHGTMPIGKTSKIQNGVSTRTKRKTVLRILKEPSIRLARRSGGVSSFTRWIFPARSHKKIIIVDSITERARKRSCFPPDPTIHSQKSARRTDICLFLQPGPQCYARTPSRLCRQPIKGPAQSPRGSSSQDALYSSRWQGVHRSLSLVAGESGCRIP